MKVVRALRAKPQLLYVRGCDSLDEAIATVEANGFIPLTKEQHFQLIGIKPFGIYEGIEHFNIALGDMCKFKKKNKPPIPVDGKSWGILKTLDSQ